MFPGSWNLTAQLELEFGILPKIGPGFKIGMVGKTRIKEKKKMCYKLSI
jgi:hypothetical protein